ncbi:hypothetical protein [Morganella morganii IS15]|nr:hypothetical protein CSB69_2655 [Morganella morganii]EMP52481.1 hypothetical protein C790_03844 [Morganella morganii SC01]CDK66092.1 hypothetical protein [Morganella morganii IS15]
MPGKPDAVYRSVTSGMLSPPLKIDRTERKWFISLQASFLHQYQTYKNPVTE